MDCTLHLSASGPAASDPEALPAARGGRRRLLRLLPAGFLLGAVGAPRAQAAGAPLLFGGTGSGLAPLQRVFEEIRVAARFVPSLGSGGGIKAVAAGAIDVALSSRRLTAAERTAGLVERELFHTPFVWAAHAAVPKTRTTLAELAQLYDGRIAHWSNGLRVRLVLRPQADADAVFVRALGPEMARALDTAEQRQGLKLAVTDDEALIDIEHIPGALGTTTLALACVTGRAVQVLELDGVVPSVQALASGGYPHRRTVRAVTRGQSGSAVALALERLGSVAAARILQRHGCQTAEAP